jgi:hypothetical protein
VLIAATGDDIKTVLDWCGRVGVVGAVIFFIVGIVLRQLGYRRMRFDDHGSILLEAIDPVGWAGVGTLAGIVIGAIIGIFAL